jgi:hypothetical protein
VKKSFKLHMGSLLSNPTKGYATASENDHTVPQESIVSAELPTEQEGSEPVPEEVKQDEPVVEVLKESKVVEVTPVVLDAPNPKKKSKSKKFKKHESETRQE